MIDNICVVIPTLNEAATIEQTIDQVRAHCNAILVIDGGSTDDTVELSQKAGADVKVLLERGKGRALIHVLQYVNHPITIFIDADGSHDGNDIPALVQPIIDGKADMVIGSRWAGGSDELHGDMNKWLRRSGSIVLTTLVNWRFGAHLSDIQNGYRAFRTEIGRNIGLEEIGFTIEQEMVMKFLAGKFRVINVPSHEYARQGGTAKLNLGQVWFKFGTVALRHLLGFAKPKIKRGDKFDQ